MCVLANAGCRGMMQSLDPVPGSHAFGGWYAPIGIRMQPEQRAVYPMITTEAIMEYLDKCVREGGWFCSVAHGIVEEEKMEIRVEDLERIMARMKEHAEKGDLWIADFNEATRYIRERQNTTVTITGEGAAYTVTLRMKEFTEDGLPLDPDVFDYPLTVRLTLPSHATGITYSSGDSNTTISPFTEDGTRYAYAELLPNTATRIEINY